MEYDVIRKNISQIKENACCIFAAFILVTIISSLMLNQGIILNDELQLRLHRLNGFDNMVSWILSCELGQGRPLRILSVCDISIGMLFKEYAKSRMVQILLLWITITVYGYFIYKLFKSKCLAFMTILIWSIFLVINFEHSVPNAFVGLTVIPVLWLLISLIFFMRWLDFEEKRDLIFSLVTWGICLLGYEYMITFSLLFPLVAMKQLCGEKANWNYALKISLKWIAVSLVYLAVFFAFRIVLPAEYSGLQIELNYPWKIFAVCFDLIKAVVPGFFLKHYAGLYDIYYYHITHLEIIQISRYHFTYLDLIFFLGANVLFWNIVKGLYSCEEKRYIKAKYIIVMLVYLVLPILPNSLTKLYHEYTFLALPVSYSLSLIMALIVSSLLILILKNSKKIVAALVMLSVTGWATLVFNMNQVISAEQNSNFNRLILMEKMIESPALNRLGEKEIFAPDLIKTKNLLGIHKGYWKSYSTSCGGRMNFAYENDNNSDVQIWENDSSFTLVKGEYGLLYSNRVLNDQSLVRISEKSAAILKDVVPIAWNGVFIYPFKINDQSQIEPLENMNYFLE